METKATRTARIQPPGTLYDNLMTRWSKMTATNAIHDACERYPSQCLPRNSYEVLGQNLGFSYCLDQQSRFGFSECRSSWTTGTTGAAKSAILQSLAELLSLPEGHNAASFFFCRGQGKRGFGGYFLHTNTLFGLPFLVISKLWLD